ncbi:MAG: hypothetical protein JW982_14565 [Spirochaetes bacterium]|nr:hypothetical protein [Spirochaetota bacterium]
MNKLCIIMILSAFLMSCGGDDPISRIFKLKAVKNVQVYATDDEIADLEKEAGKYEALVDKKIEASDNLVQVYESLGMRYLYRKDWNSAINALEKSISHGNEKDTVFQKLGTAYANRGAVLNSQDDFLNAEAYYKKTLSINNSNIDAKYGLGLLYYYKLDRKNEGYEIIRQLTVDIKDFYPARFAYGRMEYEENNKNAALGIFQSIYNDLSAVKENPEVADYKKSAKENIDRIISETGSSI